jgi:putative oxidoreductase
MKILTLVARILLGVAFVFFGANGFFHFMNGTPPPGPAAQFSEALSKTAYMQVVSAIEIVAGLLFLANRFVPLALVLLGPVIVNILLFHLCMAPSTIAPGILVTVLWFIIFFSVRPAFAGIFQAKYPA